MLVDMLLGAGISAAVLIIKAIFGVGTNKEAERQVMEEREARERAEARRWKHPSISEVDPDTGKALLIMSRASRAHRLSEERRRRSEEGAT